MVDRIALLNSLQSLPWDGEGLHCWEFVRRVDEALFGRHLPLFPIAPPLRDRVRLFRDHPERRRWREVAKPTDGSIVMMHQMAQRRPDAMHVGIFLITDGPGAIWHCDNPHGVEFISPVEASELRRWSPRYFEPACP